MKLATTLFAFPTQRVTILIAAFCFASLSGCSGGPGDAPDLVEVTGTVLMDGNPAVAANLRFISKQRGLISVGVTDENGTFRLLYKKDKWGAPADEHVVTVETGLVSETEKGTAIPAKYGDREKSGLTATVTEAGPNDVMLRLVSE